jgi:sugar-specific transcriptional regulator TrmB
MFQHEEALQILVDFGLTPLQSKIYICLVTGGSNGIGVRNISDISSVSREDVYRVLATLEKKGLVEKIIAHPTKYKPLPFEDGVCLLIKKESEKLHVKEKKAKLVLQNISIPDADPIEEESAFIVGSELSLLLKRLKEKIANTERTIDIIYYKPLKVILFHTIDELLQALEKGVKIRVICRENINEILNENLKKLKKKNSFELKIINQEIPVGLSIFDDKEVILRTGKSIVPVMWTNNENIVKLTSIYYDSMWSNGEKQEIILGDQA